MKRNVFLGALCSFLLIGTTALAAQFTVKVGYTQIEFYLNQPLTNAKGGLVPITFDYDPSPLALQVPLSLSYPFAAPGFVLSHSVQNFDIRAVLKRDEKAIFDRSKGSLDYNKVDSINTVHDAVIPFELRSSGGQVLATTTVKYQLGLICKRHN
jgi:hypothetical protein